MTLAGRRVLITGAARGIGALTARKLHERGARVALLGLEPELLAQTAAQCGDAPYYECNVTDRDEVGEAVAAAVDRLGGLDVAVANAGVGAQLPLIGGDPHIWDQTMAVNVNGTYNLIHAAGPHIEHRDGYFLLTASLAVAVHGPLMAAYSASKAAVEALGNSLRIELRPSGARVGVAYFAELDTDMTTRCVRHQGGVENAHRPPRQDPRPPGSSRCDRPPSSTGIEKRARRIVYPSLGRGAADCARHPVQRVVDQAVRRNLREALRLAREEHAPLTTPQPEQQPR